MHTKSFSLPPSLSLPSFLRSIELYSLFFNDNLTYFKYGHLWNVNSVAVGTFTINRRNFQVRTPSKIVIFALQFRRQVKDGRTFFCQLFSEFHIYRSRNIFKKSSELLLKFIFHSKYYVSFQNVDSNQNIRKKIQSFFAKISAPVLCYPLLNAWGKVEGVLKHRGKGGCT